MFILILRGVAHIIFVCVRMHSTISHDNSNYRNYNWLLMNLILFRLQRAVAQHQQQLAAQSKYQTNNVFMSILSSQIVTILYPHHHIYHFFIIFHIAKYYILYPLITFNLNRRTFT